MAERQPNPSAVNLPSDQVGSPFSPIDYHQGIQARQQQTVSVCVGAESRYRGNDVQLGYEVPFIKEGRSGRLQYW